MLDVNGCIRAGSSDVACADLVPVGREEMDVRAMLVLRQVSFGLAICTGVFADVTVRRLRALSWTGHGCAVFPTQDV